MITGSLVKRYALALLELGVEENLIDALHDDWQKILPHLDDDSDLYRALCNHTLPVVERQNVLRETAKHLGMKTPLMTRFLMLLIEKKRFNLVRDIATFFDLLADEKIGLIRAQVRSAQNLDEKTRGELTSQLSRLTGKKVEINQQLEPELIGGLIIKVGNTVYDGTVAMHLEKIKRQVQRARAGENLS